MKAHLHRPALPFFFFSLILILVLSHTSRPPLPASACPLFVLDPPPRDSAARLLFDVALSLSLYLPPTVFFFLGLFSFSFFFFFLVRQPALHINHAGQKCAQTVRRKVLVAVATAGPP